MQIAGVFVNLERSEERRFSMQRQIRELHCENWIKRFPAVDGRVHGPFDNAAENGVWACRRSHIEAVESSDEHSLLLVLEDDVELSRYFTTIVNETVLNHFVENNPRCDILFLDCVSFNGQAPFLLALSETQMKNRVRSDVSDPERHWLKGVSILDARGIFAYCTASYIVTPKGKRALRQLFAEEANSDLPIDILYREWIATGRLTANLIVPFLATPQLTNESTIPYEDLPEPSIDEKRGLLANAIRRLLFAGDHRLDMKQINNLIAEVDRSPDYELGMKLYETSRAWDQ